MREIYFIKCDFDEALPLDENDIISDSKNGEYGYRVFYDVHEGREFFENFGLEIEDELCGGQLEFTINEKGEQIGEVLLWATMLDATDDSYSNYDFVHYPYNIDEFVNDFNSIINNKECGIEDYQP